MTIVYKVYYSYDSYCLYICYLSYASKAGSFGGTYFRPIHSSVPNVLKVVPAASLSYGVYDFLNKQLLPSASSLSTTK